MKKNMERFLGLVLVLCLMVSFLPAPAYAVLEEPQLNQPAIEKVEEITVINPLYADVVTEDDLLKPSGEMVAPAATESDYSESVEEIAAVVRKAMVARQTEFTFYYKAAAYDQTYLKFLVRAGMEHTGNPLEGDYLRWQYDGYKASIGIRTASDGNKLITARITMTYHSSQAQEAELDQAVDAFLATVDTAASDYQQIKTVYDYICANVTYDYDNLNDDNYNLKYTAYAAMINGTAVCQGYAVLFYRLALELGIDARLIAGSSKGDGNQDHGWNIVCLNGKYYNLDATWDAGETSYSWFLQSEEHFTRNYTGHIRSAEYDTAEFHAAYPMSQTDFDPSEVPADPNLVAEGTCGDGVFWRLTKDGMLTISGEGAMDSCSSANDQPWKDYAESITSVLVEGTVNNIGGYSFCGLENLDSVVLEEGVSSIGDYAFEGSGLTGIEFPESMESVGEGAFASCPLMEVILPVNLKTVDSKAFFDCDDLTAVVVPAGVEAIEQSAFGSCDALQIVLFEDDAPVMDDSAFESTAAAAYYPAINETWISDVMLDYGGTIDWIAYSTADVVASGWSGNTAWELTADGALIFSGEGAMKNYSNKTEMPWYPYLDQITCVVLNPGVTSVSNIAFYGMEHLARLVLPETVTTIGNYAFKGCTALESVTLPQSGLTRIGEAAFYGCSSLKEIDIPDSIYTIWEYTFKNCTALGKIGFPKNLIKIDQGAFENCPALNYVFIPGNTEIIGAWSFKACTNLAEVDMQWADATEIRDGAFKNCTVLTKITLPADIQVLGDSCFYGIGAATFTVPATVTSVEAWCFARASVKEIIFEGNAPTIGEGAFNKITLTAYHPAGDTTWTTAVMQNYGGTVTWKEK